MMQGTTWHWVRHGPTHEKTFVGWRDVPADLSDTDLIARVSAALPHDAPVVSSDLDRCVTTADALAADRLRLTPQPGLRELHFGSWDGVHFSDVAEKHPELSRRYWEAPGDATPPGGESWDEAAHRVQTTTAHIARQHTGRDIIAVAHFGVILTQLQRALGVKASKVLAHKINNFSITSIRWNTDNAEVLRINHLP